jgi:hypothetical protein
MKITLSERIRKNYEWMKSSERKWSERKRNLHPLVTMDTDSLSREVSNKKSKILFWRIEQKKELFLGKKSFSLLPDWWINDKTRPHDYKFFWTLLTWCTISGYDTSRKNVRQFYIRKKRFLVSSNKSEKLFDFTWKCF